MSLSSELYRRGGIARSAELLKLGYTRRDMTAALASGSISRPLRGWLARPTADPALIFAAQHHVVLSCVTQAQRLKLWVRDQAGVMHVATLHRGARAPGSAAVMHWNVPWLLRPPYALVDSIENVLQCVAACQEYEAALVIWESAMNEGLIDAARLSTLPLNRRASRLRDACTPFSDSGLETLVLNRLRWLPIAVRQQVFIHGHRVDILIGARLVVQIDGGSHVGEQREADTRHDAELRQMGYQVIRVGYRQVMEQWEVVQGLVLGAIARGEHQVG